MFIILYFDEFCSGLDGICSCYNSSIKLVVNKNPYIIIVEVVLKVEVVAVVVEVVVEVVVVVVKVVTVAVKEVIEAVKA